MNSTLPTSMRKVPVGEYAEGMPWEFYTNYPLHRAYQIAVCDHALPDPAPDGDFILPLAVVAYNEGGCNCVILCLQCLMKELGRE